MTDIKRGARVDTKAVERKVEDAKRAVKDRNAAKPKKKISRNKDTIDTLQNSLNTKPKFSKMVEYSVECLRNLAVDEGSVEEMVEEGVLDTLLRVLKLNPYNENIQRMINETLKAFCINDRITSLIAQKLGAGALVHSMKKHVEPETLSSTLSTTAKLLKPQNKEVVDNFVKGGVIGGLKHIIENCKKVKVVEEAVDCLDKIAGTSPAFAHAVWDSGVAEPILKFWSEHLDEPKMTEKSISLIANLAKSDPKILEALKKMGAVDNLLAALEKHPDNEAINEVGVEALKIFTNSSDVGAALTVKVGNNNATAKSAAKLSSLLLVPENVDYMAKHEGIPWLVAALKGAVGQEGEVANSILKSGTRALGRMAKGEDKIYAIMKEGGVKVLVSILNAHGDDDDVASPALHAVSNMLTRKPNADFILKSGALEAAISVLGKNPDSEEVAKNFLELVEGLAKYPEHVPQLLPLLPKIVDIINRHGHSPEIAQLGMVAIGRMGISEDAVAKIVDAGGLKAGVAVLVQHKDNPKVAKPAVMLMETATMLPMTLEPLRALGAVKALSSSMGAIPDDQEFQELGSRTLATVAGKKDLQQALDDLKKTPRDASKADSKFYEALVPSAVVVSTLVGDKDKGAESGEYVLRAGGIPTLVAVFETAKQLPPSDPSRKELLRQTAEALTSLVPNKEVAQELQRKQFGKTLNDEAERSGDPVLQKIAEDYNKAAGVDPDAAREARLQEALDAIKTLPTDQKDPSKYDKLVPPTRFIDEALDDDEKGRENADYLAKHGAVKELLDLFDNAQKLPPGDPNRKKLLRDAASALSKLAPTDGAVDQMGQRGFGKNLRDEANRSGDPALKELADIFAKMPGGAGGADEDYSDPDNKDAMLRALKEFEAFPKDGKADPRAVSRLVNPGAFLSQSADSPSNRDFLGNNGAVRKLIDAFDALSKLPPGDPNRKKALKWLADTLGKLAPGEKDGALRRRFGKLLADEVAKSGDPELRALLDAFNKAGLGEEPLDNPGDERQLGRALQNLDDAAKEAKADPRKAGKLVIPACFLNGAGDDSKAREWLGNHGAVKKLIDAFEALKNMDPKDPNRKKALKNIAELLSKLNKEPGAAREIAERKFGQLLRDEAVKSGDPDLQRIMEEFDAPFKGSASASLPKTRGLATLPYKPEKEALEVDTKRFEDIVQKGGLPALAAFMNKNKSDPAVFPAAAAVFAKNLQDASDEQLQKLLDDPACVEALMNLMKANETLATPLALADLSRAIGAAARLKLKPATAKQMLKNNPIAALMKMMTQSDDPLLLANAAKLLGRLAGNDEALQLMAQIASIRELIDAMRRNIKNQEFLRYGCYLLGEFAAVDRLKSEIGVEGGIGLILQIVGLYPKNKDLVENACFALAQCSYNHPVNATFITASNGINTIIATMAAYPKAEELLENAVCTLCNICYENNRNKDAIVKAGGSQAIVDTLLNNFDALELVSTGLRTLGQLAYNKPNSEAIIKAGGVQGIVAAMTVHSDKEDIILLAIRVLTNLAADASDESMQAMAQEGAVQAVVEATITYCKSPEIELAALSALCNLGLAKYNASMIIKQGGVEAIADAFTEHSYEAKITEKGCRLAHILTHSAPDLDRMVESKISDGLLGALKAHGKNKAILSPALCAIAALAYGEKAAKKIADMTPGLVPAIMATLKTNLADPSIVIDSFKALSALSRFEGSALGMSDMTMKTYITALQTHASNTKVLEAGFRFIGNLCFHKVCSDLIPTIPVVPATLTALAVHKGEPATLMHGCKALENMAYGAQPVKEYMKAQGVIQAMKQIQTDNPTRDDVKRAAQAVIDALTRVDIDIDFKPMSLMPQFEKKKAKDLFGHEEKGPVVILPKEIRNLLNAGALMYKHSKTAQPRKRHVYVDTELKFIIWRDPKEKQLNPKNKMKVGIIKQIEKGLCTPQLQRTTLIGKKPMAKEDCSFAVIGRERTIDLETPHSEERDKWVHALEILVEYKRALKAARSVFGAR